MRERPTAIGYLRRDVSGVSQAWDEIQIRSRAARLGYDLAKTIVFDRYTDNRLMRLLQAVERDDAEAVFVPSASHFSAGIPPELVEYSDVVTVNPEFTYSRTISLPIFADDP
ncbi:hypothetical protein [Nocardia sp. XZ_19_385]|uniref:hypothetical protein n=1 Tax=Nocardia sp. XZ_19_385 TaxID=2769488 RepID=UPI00188F120E|nr:hypothetical protein [Nocardia sp. XZ_19_385]